MNAQWTQALAQNYTGSVGTHISKEYDYLSLGINGNIAYDFNKKNSTISFGLSHFQDTFEPEGGIPKSFSSLPSAYHEGDKSEHDASRQGSDDDKTTSDVMVGFTQVINRRMVTQFFLLVCGWLFNGPI